jgi:hypothetical protein
MLERWNLFFCTTVNTPVGVGKPGWPVETTLWAMRPSPP